MDETADYEVITKKLLEIMPDLHRLVATQIKLLTENETTMMQLGALHMLMQKGNMTTSDLAKHRHVSMQASSTFVQGLVDRGWVRRTEDPNDRRRAILEVTEEGRAQQTALQNKIINYTADLMKELNLEEAVAGEIFLTGLYRIIQRYKAENSWLEDKS